MRLPNLPLSDDNVREILRLYKQGEKTVPEIAAQFGRAVNTIHKILTGQSYRHITAEQYHRPRKCKGCVDCAKDRRREQNIAIGEAARLVGVCVRCGDPAEVKATKLLGRPASVLCARHDRRARA